jgi:hypothetical protein
MSAPGFTQKRFRIPIRTWLKVMLIYILSLIACAILTVLLEITALGMGWAFVFGDSDPPQWYTTCMGVGWFAGIGIAPFLASCYILRRYRRRAAK